MHSDATQLLAESASFLRLLAYILLHRGIKDQRTFLELHGIYNSHWVKLFSHDLTGLVGVVRWRRGVLHAVEQ